MIEPVLGLRLRAPVRLHSVYLDTAAFALARHGIALRVRRQGRRWEATAKWAGTSAGSLHQRPELTVPLPGPPPDPFELPEGKIEFISKKPKQGVENAVKYADFAIGRLFELAKKETTVIRRRDF